MNLWSAFPGRQLDRLSVHLTSENHHSNTISLFRKGLYALLLYNTLRLLPMADIIWGPESMMLAQPDWGSPFFAIQNLLARESIAPYFWWFIGGQLVFLLFGFLGRFPRLSAIMIWFFTENLINRGTELSNGGYHLMALLVLFQVFLSEKPLPARWGSFWQEVNHLLSNLGVWGCRLQVAILYATAAGWKLLGEQWLTGDAMFYVLQVPRLSLPWVQDHLDSLQFLLVGASFFVFGFQLLFPVLVWFRRFRPWILLAGTVFHLGIVFLLGLPDFGFMMIVSYLLFYPNGTAGKWLLRLRLTPWVPGWISGSVSATESPSPTP